MILNQHQLNIQSRLSTLIKSKGNVMNLIFFKPRNIGFLMRMIKERLLELFLKREDLASDVRNYVLNNAKKNDPDSVLNTMDEFAKRKRTEILYNLLKYEKINRLKYDSLVDSDFGLKYKIPFS